MGVAARVGRVWTAPLVQGGREKEFPTQNFLSHPLYQEGRPHTPYAASLELALERLVAHDGAAFVAYPIGKTEVIHPDVLKPGADRRGGTQGCPAAALAMGDDMIPRAESYPIQHGAQGRCRTNNAILQEIDMR